MSTVEPTDRPVPAAILDGAVEEYPRDKLYVIIAVILASLTFVEVMTYYAPKFPLWNWGSGSHVGLVLILLVLMVAKFAIVGMFFMHLKWDKPILWRLFVSGIVLALGVYVAVMMMFRLFTPDSMVKVH